MFGGRAIQRREYSRESVATLESEGISIDAAAEFEYAKVHGDVSFNFDQAQ